MTVEADTGDAVARIAAAIGEPARARMLFCLMGNRARTSTELALIARVSPSTASVHLNRLKDEGLVSVHVQGKHRYYSLEGADVATALEGLSVLAGASSDIFVPSTPEHLRAARTCYDHMAGTLAVALHDQFTTLGWLTPASRNDDSCDLTAAGCEAFELLGIDVHAPRALRRRFAFACLDWSERRSHLGGALGAAFLAFATRKKWVVQDSGSRALRVTGTGRREMSARFGLRF